MRSEAEASGAWVDRVSSVSAWHGLPDVGEAQGLQARRGPMLYPVFRGDGLRLRLRQRLCLCRGITASLQRDIEAVKGKRPSPHLPQTLHEEVVPMLPA